MSATLVARQKSDKMSEFSGPTDFAGMSDDALLGYWMNAALVIKGAYDTACAFLGEVRTRFHAAKQRGETFWGYKNFDRLCDEKLDWTSRQVRRLTSGAVPSATPKPKLAHTVFTVKDLMDWYNAGQDENFNDFTIERRRGAMYEHVDLKFPGIDPAIAKKVAEYYLRLRKTTSAAVQEPAADPDQPEIPAPKGPAIELGPAAEVERPEELSEEPYVPAQDLIRGLSIIKINKFKRAFNSTYDLWLSRHIHNPAPNLCPPEELRQMIREACAQSKLTYEAGFQIIQVWHWGGYHTDPADLWGPLQEKEVASLRAGSDQHETPAPEEVAPATESAPSVEPETKAREGRCTAIGKKGKHCPNPSYKDGFCRVHHPDDIARRIDYNRKLTFETEFSLLVDDIRYGDEEVAGREPSPEELRQALRKVSDQFKIPYEDGLKILYDFGLTSQADLAILREPAQQQKTAEGAA